MAHPHKRSDIKVRTQYVNFLFCRSDQEGPCCIMGHFEIGFTGHFNPAFFIGKHRRVAQKTRNSAIPVCHRTASPPVLSAPGRRQYNILIPGPPLLLLWDLFDKSVVTIRFTIRELPSEAREPFRALSKMICRPLARVRTAPL